MKRFHEASVEQTGQIRLAAPRDSGSRFRAAAAAMALETLALLRASTAARCFILAITFRAGAESGRATLRGRVFQ